MKMQAETEFVAKLQKQAAIQAKLHSMRLLPSRLDPITSVIGQYPWQFLLISSAITAVILRLLKAGVYL